MRVNRLTFSTAEIDAGTTKDAYLDIAVSGGVIGGVQQVDIIRKYPTSMSIVNTTGSSLDIAILANQIEADDFVVTPSNYQFLLPNNSSIGFSTRIGRVYKINVKKNSGTTSSSLRIDFGNIIGITKIN